MTSAKDDLATKLIDLEKRATDLERQLAAIKEGPAPFKPAEPHQPIDYTRGASMDRETMKDLAGAIPPDLARDLHADLARGNPATAPRTMLTPDHGGEVQRGSGYRDAVPLGPPSGIEHCDRIMDMADAQDRADLERRLARSVRKE